MTSMKKRIKLGLLQLLCFCYASNDPPCPFKKGDVEGYERSNVVSINATDLW
jgi:hypothetical protein